MSKKITNEHLLHFLEKTTPYQRMVWLKKALEFWRTLKVERAKKVVYNKLKRKAMK